MAPASATGAREAASDWVTNLVMAGMTMMEMVMVGMIVMVVVVVVKIVMEMMAVLMMMVRSRTCDASPAVSRAPGRTRASPAGGCHNLLKSHQHLLYWLNRTGSWTVGQVAGEANPAHLYSPRIA